MRNRRSLRCLLVGSLVCTLTAPRSSNAYILPVVDVANLAINTASLGMETTSMLKNIIMAAQLIMQVKLMTDQVANSDAEVAMMARNLLNMHDMARYNLPLYELMLLGMSVSAGPRPKAARNLDYFQPALQAALKILTPGYIPTYGHAHVSAELADIHLNTIEAAMGRMNVQAGRESDVRYDMEREELYWNNEGAAGNLQAQQTGNAIGLMASDGIRRLEKSNAEIANLIAVRNAKEQQEESWGRAATEHSLILATGKSKIPPSYNRGAGGVNYFAPMAGGTL